MRFQPLAALEVTASRVAKSPRAALSLFTTPMKLRMLVGLAGNPSPCRAEFSPSLLVRARGEPNMGIAPNAPGFLPGIPIS